MGIKSKKLKSYSQLMQSSALRNGIGCFETIKINAAGQIAFLEEHCKRLIEGAEFLGFGEASAAELQEEVIWLVKDYFRNLGNIEVSEEQTYVLRLLFTEDFGLDGFILPHKKVNEPVSLFDNSTFRIDSLSPLNQYKSFNYLANHLAAKEAIKEGFTDTLLLNEKEQIVETTKANIFFKLANVGWVTPSKNAGCLPGVIREKLMKLLQAKEQNTTLSNLKNCNEVIVSNSLIGAQSVCKVGALRFKEAKTETINKQLDELAFN